MYPMRLRRPATCANRRLWGCTLSASHRYKVTRETPSLIAVWRSSSTHLRGASQHQEPPVPSMVLPSRTYLSTFAVLANWPGSAVAERHAVSRCISIRQMVNVYHESGLSLNVFILRVFQRELQSPPGILFLKLWGSMAATITVENRRRRVAGNSRKDVVLENTAPATTLYGSSITAPTASLLLFPL